MPRAALLLLVALSGACTSSPPPIEDVAVQAERETRELLMRIVVALGNDSEHPHLVRFIGKRLGTAGWILTTRDPWDQRFWLDGNARDQLIVGSSGPDRVAGTADDIVAALPHPLPDRWNPTSN